MCIAGCTPNNNNSNSNNSSSSAIQPCAQCAITSETVATSPADRARTRIGVGEEVKLTVNPGPATWAITSGNGTLSPAGSQTTVTFTAADKAETVVITATGTGCSCTITFTVVEPSGWTMKRKPGTNLRHVQGRPDCGWRGILFVQPNEVNFYRLEIREKDSKYETKGSYKPFDGVYHGNYPPPDRVSPWITFTMTSHAAADGTPWNGIDTIDTGDPGAGATGAAPPFVVGTGRFPITMQWRVGTGAPRDFAVSDQKAEIFEDGRCESRKGGNTERTMYTDPSSTP